MSIKANKCTFLKRQKQPNAFLRKLAVFDFVKRSYLFISFDSLIAVSEAINDMTKIAIVASN